MAASKHVAVLAFPFTSHAATLLSLIRRISEATPDVTFFFFSTAQSNDSVFSKSEEHGKIRPYSVSNGLPEGYAFNGNMYEAANYFVKALPGNFKGAMDKIVEETGKDFDCLVTDAFYWFGADLAEELQVPWLPLWIAGPRSLFLHLETDKIRQYIKSYGSKETTLDLFPEFSAIRACDLPPEITSENVDAPFTVMLHKMGLELPRATAILGDNYEELDTTIVNMLKSRFQKYLPVGPLFLTCQPPPFVDPHGCLEWLNKHQTASVVYIGFGTALKPPPHELLALAEAMEEMGLPYLWSLKDDPEQELLRAFVERTREKGKIVPWTPQRQVLEHPSVGVHVTHGGWKSIMESILGGVPLICRPFFADNQLNSRTVEAVWGIGLTVERGVFTKEGTLKALNLILFDEEGKKMRKKIEIHKELVRKTVEPSSSSTVNFKTLIKIIREHQLDDDVHTFL